MSDRLAALERLSRDLVEALRAHIDADSRRCNIAPVGLCPCTLGVLAEAAQILTQPDDEEDPEPVMDDRDPVEAAVGPDPEGEPWDV